MMQKIKNWSRRKPGTALLLFVILFTGSLNLGGFCYSEVSFLSEKELIARYIFYKRNPAALDMTEKEKIKLAKEEGFDYPDCCRIETKRFEGGTMNVLLNWWRYEMSIARKKSIPDNEGEYYYGGVAINSCGTKLLGLYSSSETKESHDATVSGNRKWRPLDYSNKIKLAYRKMIYSRQEWTKIVNDEDKKN